MLIMRLHDDKRQAKAVRSFGIVIFIVLSCIFMGHLFAEETFPRGLYVSLLQDPPVLSSAADIQALIDFANKARIPSLFVQVYRANQTWFPSSAGDQTPYDLALRNIGEDPLAFLIQRAHRQGIEVHAWISVLALEKNHRAPIIKKYGPEILTRNITPKRSLSDYRIDSRYFLEPGDPRTREELATLVGELLNSYPDLDGIHFDDVMYSDKNTSLGYSPVNIERFKEETGQLVIYDDSKPWQDWKRTQVTACLNHLAQKARSLNPRIQISAAGRMPYTQAREEFFQDWTTWLSGGIVDFIVTLNYAQSTKDFEKHLFEVITKSGDFKKVITAIGAHELMKDPDIFAKQFQLCQAANGKACLIFHYGSLLSSEESQDFLMQGKIPKKRDNSF